jgi:hypothetical protein
LQRTELAAMRFATHKRAGRPVHECAFLSTPDGLRYEISRLLATSLVATEANLAVAAVAQRARVDQAGE